MRLRVDLLISGHSRSGFITHPGRTRPRLITGSTRSMTYGRILHTPHMPTCMPSYMVAHEINVYLLLRAERV